MAPSSSNLKKNKNGGTYVNGKSLPLPLRKEIVERYVNGERVMSIARSIKVTHGVVSKITLHYAKTGSYLPRNIRPFCDKPAPISNNAIPSPLESPSSFDDSSDEYIDVVSFTPPPAKMPFTVDAMLDNTIKPADTSKLNPVPENAPIISSLQAIQMAQLLELQSSLLANQWHPVDIWHDNTANSAAILNPVTTNLPKPPTASYPIPTNVTMPPTVPNLPTSAVQIIPPPEIAQFAQLQQLQWLNYLVWMNSADLLRL